MYEKINFRDHLIILIAADSMIIPWILHLAKLPTKQGKYGPRYESATAENIHFESVYKSYAVAVAAAEVRIDKYFVFLDGLQLAKLQLRYYSHQSGSVFLAMQSMPLP